MEPLARQGRRLLAAGMTWADTPRAVAEKSEIVFSIVTDGAAVRAVALGTTAFWPACVKAASMPT